MWWLSVLGSMRMFALTSPLLLSMLFFFATPLYNLLQKNTKFDWTTDCDTAFNQLKYALVHAPVLAMPDFDADFVVETDASDVAVGAVLMQHDWPVAFMSKALNSAQCNYHTTDRELLANVLACK